MDSITTTSTSHDSGVFQRVKELHRILEDHLKTLPVIDKAGVEETVQAIVELDCPLPAKYVKVDVADLIKRNKIDKTSDGQSTLVAALGLLEKYGRNLLLTPRPAGWKLINFTNVVFKTRVDIIKGTRNVLKLMGYSELVENGLSFPSHVDSADLDTVATVTADLGIARAEIKLFSRGQHPHPYRIMDCVDGRMASIAWPLNSKTADGDSGTVYIRQPFGGREAIYENLPLTPRFSPGFIRDGQLGNLAAQGLGDSTLSGLDGAQQAKTAPKHQAKPAVDVAVHKTEVSPRISPIPYTTSSKAKEMSSPQPAKPNVVAGSDRECVMCGQTTTVMQCSSCSGLRCDECDSKWHLYPLRRGHQRSQFEPLPDPGPDVTVLRAQRSCVSCGSERTTVLCKDCSNTYCGNCDSLYHEHLQRRGQLGRGLLIEEAAPDLASVQPRMPKTIVLSPLQVPDALPAADASSASNKKKPVPTPRRSLRNKTSLNIQPSQINPPAAKTDKETVATTKPTLLNISASSADLRSPSGRSPLPPPISPKPAKLPAQSPTVASLKSQLQALIRRDIEILKRISALNAEKPNMSPIRPEVTELMADHLRILADQKELEKLLESKEAQSPSRDNSVMSARHAPTLVDDTQFLFPPSPIFYRTASLSKLSTPSPIGTTKPVTAAKPGPATPVSRDQPPVVSSVAEDPLCQLCGHQNRAQSARCTSCGNHSSGAAAVAENLPVAAQRGGRPPQVSDGPRLDVCSPTTPKQTPTGLSTYALLQQEEEEMIQEKRRAKLEDLKRQGKLGESKEIEGDIGEMVSSTEPPTAVDQLPRAATAPIVRSQGENTLASGTVKRQERQQQWQQWQQQPRQEEQLQQKQKQQQQQQEIQQQRQLQQQLQAEDRKRLEEQRSQSLNFMQLIRKAEGSGYFPEDIAIASVKLRDDIAVPRDQAQELGWLDANWGDHVHTVVAMATNRVEEMLGRRVGVVPPEEAARMLRKYGGDVEKAVRVCTRKLQKTVTDLASMGYFSGDIYQSLLAANQGQADDPVVGLQQEKARKFGRNIWLADDETRLGQRIVALGQDSNDETKERRARLLLAEYAMPSWGRAITATRLIDDHKYDILDAITAATECGDYVRAQQYLEKECRVCYTVMPMNKLSTLSHCQCTICLQCLQQHFSLIIAEKNIMKAMCPACDEPNLRTNDTDFAGDYFGFLDILLKVILDDKLYRLFQVKMRDWSLMKEKNFRWCAHCGNGFINEAPNRRKMRCPECNQLTCFLCKKPWMEQHEKTSCADFQAWKEANDPNRQQEGLAIHLKENGIDCPQCSMRYELAKGGCMHFKCVQCTHEFCSGCNSPFSKVNECTRFASCRNKGLHAHHPRDCLFYLRDQEIAELQRLLQKHNVDYKRDTPANQEPLCQVKEQRETPEGLADDNCGRQVVVAGLCKLHYTEYLVSRINQHHIDPADEYNVADLTIILQRNDLPDIERLQNESEGVYKSRLLQEVKVRLPLQEANPRDRNQPQ